MNAKIFAVLAGLALAAPAWADDKPKATKSPATIVLDVSKLPLDVLAQLLKLAADKKGEPDKKNGDGDKKGDAPAAAASLGFAVVMAEKSGKTVVRAEKKDGVFVLDLADGSILKVLAEETRKGDAPNTKKRADAPTTKKKGDAPNTKKQIDDPK